MSEEIFKLNDSLYKLQAATSTADQAHLKARLDELELKMTLHIKDNSLHGRSGSPRKPTEEGRGDEEEDLMNPSPGRSDGFKKEIIDKLKQQKGDFNKALKKL